MEEQLISLIAGVVGIDKLPTVALWVTSAISAYTVLIDPLLPPATESSPLAYKIWCRVAKYVCGNFGHNKNKEGTV